MKRLNPETGLPFVRGFVRKDGRIFKQYVTNKIKKDGYFGEHWTTLSQLKKTQNCLATWKKANPDKIITHRKSWLKNNLNKHNAKTAKQRASKLQRTPPWLTAEHFAEIQAFYTQSKALTQSTGVAYHVDHIVPLRGESVSGLHVPWNLQVITATENCSKNNRFIEM